MPENENENSSPCSANENHLKTVVIFFAKFYLPFDDKSCYKIANEQCLSLTTANKAEEKILSVGSELKLVAT